MSAPTAKIQLIEEFVRPTPLGNFLVKCYVIDEQGSTGFAVMRGKIPAENLLVTKFSHPACLVRHSESIHAIVRLN